MLKSKAFSIKNFHLTKSINIEVGRALSQLGYKPHKTNTCQMYAIEEK